MMRRFWWRVWGRRCMGIVYKILNVECWIWDVGCGVLFFRDEEPEKEVGDQTDSTNEGEDNEEEANMIDVVVEVVGESGADAG